MRRGYRLALVFAFGILTVLFVLSIGVGATAVSFTSDLGDTDEEGPAAALQDIDDVDPDDIQIEIAVDEHGDASWQIDYRIHLDDEASELAFEAIEADIESNPDIFIDEFASQIESTVENAQEGTEREMATHSMVVDTDRQTLPNEVGIIRYGFEWENFAATEGDTVQVGDAISGFFLSDETTLVLNWSESLQVASVTPEADQTREHAVIWNGQETEFVSDEPSVSLDLADESEQPEDPADDSEAPPGQEEDESTGISLPIMLGIAGGLVLVTGLGGMFVWRIRDNSGTRNETTQTTESAETSSSTEKQATPAYADDLLSNEERAIKLLEHEGGRMKQKEIATTLEWTDAKTSRVVSDLKDADEIDVYRLGRENVVQLPEKPDL